MPRMIVPPYQNKQLGLQVDAVKKRRAQMANTSILRERMKAGSVPPISATVASISATPKKAFQLTPLQRRNGSVQN